jgi:hypothetical protein
MLKDCEGDVQRIPTSEYVTAGESAEAKVLLLM